MTYPAATLKNADTPKRADADDIDAATNMGDDAVIILLVKMVIT